MLNKTRSDSRLAQLPPEQQAEIYRRLKTQTYSAVKRWLAQPPPDGFGLKTHINSLYRFFHRYDVNAAFEQSVLLALSPNAPAHAPDRMGLAALEEAGRLIAANPNALAAFNLLSRHFHRLELGLIQKENRAIALEQERLALMRADLQLKRSAFHASKSAAPKK